MGQSVLPTMSPCVELCPYSTEISALGSLATDHCEHEQTSPRKNCPMKPLLHLKDVLAGYPGKFLPVLSRFYYSVSWICYT